MAITLNSMIPIGTRIVFKTFGNELPNVYVHKHDEIGNIAEFGNTTAVMLRQDP